jgi:geranylgeranylglycerol-phosphate geranylgeranyltransferase
MLNNALKPSKLSRLFLYFELIKPEKTSFYWLNTLAGVFLASNFLPYLSSSLMACLSIGFTAFSIYALNDVCDEEIDRINKSNRPISSGRLGKAEALALVSVFSAIGIFLASAVNPTVLMFVLIYLLLGVAYSVDPLRLKKGLFANVCMASGVAVSILAGASVVQITDRVLFGTVAMFFFVWSCGSGKDMKDVEGDRLMHIKTLPVIIGERKTMFMFTINSVLSFSIFFFGYLFNFFNPSYLLLLILALIRYMTGLRMMWINPGDQTNCERAFSKLVPASMLLLLALILGSIDI